MINSIENDFNRTPKNIDSIKNIIVVKDKINFFLFLFLSYLINITTKVKTTINEIQTIIINYLFIIYLLLLCPIYLSLVLSFLM